MQLPARSGEVTGYINPGQDFNTLLIGDPVVNCADANTFYYSQVGMGFPFLKAASQSYEAVCELLERVIAELKVAMQLSGAATITALQQVDIVVTGETRNWLTMRGFEETLRAMAQRRWSKMQ